ncbi:MAG: ribosome maturation factor RimM [Erysipelotrichaceae bacterium]|nr:ribosome maturation factor RimM [Erysipelotrichaceae bacterium]
MEKVKIGKIVNTHGIKGELKVKSMTDFPEERFAKGSIVTLHYQNQDINMEVLKHRYHKGHILVTFKGYEDINLVEKYKGCSLYSDKDVSLLDEGEYYVDDLIGCKVYNYDNYIGDVIEVQLYDHHDILVVQGKEKIMIPYVEAFVKEEDIDNKRINVELIGGFIHEN